MEHITLGLATTYLLPADLSGHGCKKSCPAMEKQRMTRAAWMRDGTKERGYSLGRARGMPTWREVGVSDKASMRIAYT